MTIDPGTGTGNRQVFAYFGHHKCASTWIMNILGRVAVEIGLQPYVVVDELTPYALGPLTDFQSTFERASLRERVDLRGAELVSCMTADREQANALRASRAFHVIRDPRDIIVSAYFSHRNSHPTEGLSHLAAHREELLGLSLDEGLLSEMAFSRAELLQIGEWDYGDETVLELKTEELTAHPYSGFIEIFRHLGLLVESEPTLATAQARTWVERLVNRLSRRPGLQRLRHPMQATGEIVLGTVYAQRFDAQAGGRTRGTEDPSSHYRKGVAGDWRNYFKGEHIEAFSEQFGDLLVRLGYEADLGWSSRPMLADA
jgi:hypothetical protein